MITLPLQHLAVKNATFIEIQLRKLHVKAVLINISSAKSPAEICAEANNLLLKVKGQLQVFYSNLCSI